jgi:ribulose-phosphate 3-epimerase
MREFWIAPSILSADFARLGEDVDAVIAAGADLIHFDVMDNAAPIDVHLMVKPVDRIIADFAAVGATYISFHPEASEHTYRSLQLIRDAGCKSGLVFNPATPLTWLEHVLHKVDMVLLMSVNPGFGGQAFIDTTLEKITRARALIDESGLDVRLEVDGGVKVDNIGRIAQAGADTFVAGSAIFGSDDYAATLAAMRNEISAALD